jgi:hypothetical protein
MAEVGPWPFGWPADWKFHMVVSVAPIKEGGYQWQPPLKYMEKIYTLFYLLNDNPLYVDHSLRVADPDQVHPGNNVVHFDGLHTITIFHR